MVEDRTDADTEPFSRAALVEDLRALADALEAVHADPYRGYGGQLAFHRRLERLVETMPETATATEFHRHVSPLVTGLRDGHTKLSLPADDADDRRLPISLRVIGEELVVDAVSDETDTALLGARLTAVEGHSVADLLARRTLKAAENRYHERYRLASRLEEYARLDRLLDRDAPPDPVAVTATRDGRTIERRLEPVPGDAEPTETLPATVPTPDGSGPRYQLYESGAGAVFIPGDLQGFRESYENFQAMDSDIVEELAPEAYRRHVGGDPPDDIDDIVAALPSMLETVVDLAEAMAAHDTETLIVDLRDNPGGDSTFVYHLAYALYGWDGVATASESITAVKRRTGPHRERYGLPEDEPTTAERNPADYDFGAAFKDVDRATRVDHLRDTLTRSATAAAIVEAEDTAGVYDPPRLVVLTTAKTFSSAFAGVAQLSTLGADVVGVPSGQAPVSYGEAVERTLPNTGLEASIAGAAYEWLPDPDGAVLEADRELTPDRFRAYDRADDAALRLAFEHAGLTDGRPPEPV